jgi:glycolate oxidase subunit GlcD
MEASWIGDLKSLLGPQRVLTDLDQLLVYECDALSLHKHRPEAVLFPTTTEEVAQAVKILSRQGVPFVARGAGTGLSGGAVAPPGGVIIELARMNRILRIDYENRLAVVEPGVINIMLSRAVADAGFFYAPDPSSQMSCTIGGNVAENSGGPHCLKYGMTASHILGLEVVLPTGEIVSLGGEGSDAPGYDLRGLFIGSEGTFGIATKITVGLTPLPQAVQTLLVDFLTVEAASRAVSEIIAAGVLPSALEMMDRATIQAVEDSMYASGLPTDAAAVLLIEVDGLAVSVESEAERIAAICHHWGARTVRRARDEAERARLWAGRKGAFGAMGRISPDLMVQDAVIPRSKLPDVLPEVYRIADRYRLTVANVFHAGDGNLHPNICYDGRNPEEVARVDAACRDIMELCLRVGGALTGEHGIGLDKIKYMPLAFSPADLEAMAAVRAVFDPQGLCNPGKVLPVRRCRAF